MMESTRNASRRRVSRTRQQPAASEEQWHLLNEEKKGDDTTISSTTSPLAHRIVYYLGKALMRGLYDGSGGSSGSEFEDDEDDQEQRRQLSEKKTEKKRRQRRRRESRSDFLSDPHTSEDVLANEGEIGGHLPFLFPRQRSASKERRDRQIFGISESEVEEKKSFILFRPIQWFRNMKAQLQEDFNSILLLNFLYLLQGIPLGLIAAIPLILQDKNVTFGQQAVFSLAYWPFSLKLFWAPIVDAVYVKKIGRRKSWMVPCQYLIGLGLLYISYTSHEILGSTNNKDPNAPPPNVLKLLFVFLPLNFLAATQDIAVDGWALTMLSRKNVGYASTCNVVGQTIGFFMGNIGLITLNSERFANMFRAVPRNEGLVTLPTFVFFWGWVFIISTTLVFIFKREVDKSVEASTDGRAESGNAAEDQVSGSEEFDEASLGIIDTYKVLIRIIFLKPVLWMAVVLLTAKIAFAATDGMTDLKLINMGVKKEEIASRGLFLTPLQIILPWLLGKQTSGRRPLTIFLISYPYRIIMGLVFAALVYFTPHFQLEDGKYPYSYFIIWIIAYYFQQASAYCIFLSMMAFNAQVSDPAIGGTYMTLLNTLNNMGGNWPMTLFLSITDFFTFKNCVAKGTQTVLGACNSKVDAELCASSGDVCEMYIDGYYISVGVCTVVGFIWYRIFYPKIQWFQRIPREEWRVIKNK